MISESRGDSARQKLGVDMNFSPLRPAMSLSDAPDAAERLGSFVLPERARHFFELSKYRNGLALAEPAGPPLPDFRLRPDQAGDGTELPGWPVLAGIREQRLPRHQPYMRGHLP